MIKEEQNIANIFFPDQKLDSEGFLVGYNFEGFLFVITSVIPSDKIESIPMLQQIIQEQKFQTFNRYCASEPIILGIIESEPNDGQSSLSKRADTLEFKQD